MATSSAELVMYRPANVAALKQGFLGGWGGILGIAYKLYQICCKLETGLES